MPDSPLELGSLLWFVPLSLLLIALIIWRVWRVSRRLGVWIMGVTILGITIFTVAKSFSPEGAYSCVNEIDRFDTGKDEFVRLSRGRFERVRGGEILGYDSYQKTREGWTVIPSWNKSRVWRLEFSVFGFRIISENNDRSAFFPRRLIPIARPHWMPDWLQ